MRGTFVKYAAVAAFALFGAGTTALAQNCSCTIVNGCKEITFYDDNGNVIDQILDCGNTGSGNFNCTKEVPPTGPLNQSYNPTGITATIQDPNYGAITTSLNAARRSSPTTLISNTRERFPATLTLSFFGEASISSRPDSRYASRTELVFQSTNINSVAPFRQEQIRLLRDVEFYDVNDADQSTAFVLKAGSGVTLDR